MQPYMIWAIAIAAAIFVAGAIFAMLLYRRELRRITRFLVFRQMASNARLTSSASDRELVKLVQAINQQLDAMQGEQIGRLRERQEYQQQLSSFSHDVRTPLMGAKGYLQLALDESDRNTRTRYLEAVETQIDDVRRLLDQLHAYTQSVDPDAEYDIRNIQIMPVIVNVLYEFYPVFEERHWEPQVDFENQGFFAPCDEMAVKRIFGNLVSNALKYGSSAPSIVQRERTIWFSNQIEKPMTIDVNRVFERFYQVDPSRGVEGTGLGLTVVSNLAHAMKVEVSAESVENEFRIRLDFPD